MLDEKLSALMDDELDASELDGCLDDLFSNESSRLAWDRQHLLRAAIQGQLEVSSTDLADRVMQALDEDAELEDQPAPKVVRFPGIKAIPRQWAGGLAVAASVALAALIVPFDFIDSDTGTSANLAATNTSTTAVAYKQRIRANEEARREMQQYLLDHEALVSGHGLNDQRSYMRMASPSTTYVAYTPE